jgi:hypothetical protein
MPIIAGGCILILCDNTAEVMESCPDDIQVKVVEA